MKNRAQYAVKHEPKFSDIKQDCRDLLQLRLELPLLEQQDYLGQFISMKHLSKLNFSHSSFEKTNPSVINLLWCFTHMLLDSVIGIIAAMM